MIRGEPGTGKTVLAEAIAENLGMTLLTWHIKIDHQGPGRALCLRHRGSGSTMPGLATATSADIRQYIKLGPLGQALRAEKRVVLLIDEIDKADMEFPNDLLHELDRMSFAVAETGDHFTANERPIVVITSNNEKELPDAFLRRCVFHYIEFPDKETMTEIVRVHHPDVAGRALAAGAPAILLAARAARDSQAALDQRADRLDRGAAPRRHRRRGHSSASCRFWACWSSARATSKPC